MDAADRRGGKPEIIAAVTAIAAAAAIVTGAAGAACARRWRTAAIAAHGPAALRVPVAG